jgi:cell division protein FtsN
LKNLQQGRFLPGFVVGLVVGLGIALAVAMYVTRTPVPFVDKLPQRTPAQDAAEAARNRNWDPNAGLPGKGVRPQAASAPQASASGPGGAASGATSSLPARAGAAAASAPGRDPAAILSGSAVEAGAAEPPSAKGARAPGEPFIVQAGAYQRTEDAEAQRARIGMLGMESRIVERQQSGRTVYRVRLGPFERQAVAEAVRERLAASGLEAVTMRVEKTSSP